MSKENYFLLQDDGSILFQVSKIFQIYLNLGTTNTSVTVICTNLMIAPSGINFTNYSLKSDFLWWCHRLRFGSRIVITLGNPIGLLGVISRHL